MMVTFCLVQRLSWQEQMWEGSAVCSGTAASLVGLNHKMLQPLPRPGKWRRSGIIPVEPYSSRLRKQIGELSIYLHNFEYFFLCHPKHELAPVQIIFFFCFSTRYQQSVEVGVCRNIKEKHVGYALGVCSDFRILTCLSSCCLRQAVNFVCTEYGYLSKGFVTEESSP